jgi:hypothetical protein
MIADYSVPASANIMQKLPFLSSARTVRVRALTENHSAEKAQACLPKDICRTHIRRSTGRSGAHLLGYALENHPHVRATIEAQPMFRLSVTMALNSKP